MHEVILYPSKCVKQSSWIKKHKEGNRIQVDLCIAPVKTEERKVVGLSCLFG